MKLSTRKDLVVVKQKQSVFKNAVASIKNIFSKLRPKRGYEKYRMLRWGHYTNTEGTFVTYQNLKSGEIYEHSFEVKMLEFDAVNYWLSKKK